MKRGRLPLTALRSFEVAGRLESITLAAEELFVSQAAVSRQVRELEAQLGQRLFERHHRRLELTPAGAKLLGVLTSGFDSIDDCLARLYVSSGVSNLSLSVEPSFAVCWLVQHLSDFRIEHPDIDVNVESDIRLIELRSHDAEIAIRYAAAQSKWPRTQSKKLYNVEMVPVAATGFLNEFGHPSAPEDLLKSTLLHEENREDWEDWFRVIGVSNLTIERGPIFADGGLVMQAVLDGQGIGLLDKRHVAREIANGRIQQLFDIPFKQGAYWLVTRDFSKLSQPAKHFVDWISTHLNG
jgi:LysR family glycine cleavage system transcriptional activator